jgi:hypothetical protein
LLFAIALGAGLIAIALGWTAIPEAGRNPASPEFGALRTDALRSVALATVLIGVAIAVSARRGRLLFVALLLVTWAAALVPAYQYIAFHPLPDFMRSAPRR